MRGHGWNAWGGVLGVVALMMFSALRATAQEPGEGPALDPPAAADVVPEAPVELPDRWIGVACEPVPPAVRAQLSVPEGQGILVGQVVPDSPADKAGIKQFDVLVAVDGKPLVAATDLVGAVAAGEEKLSLELLRGGKKKTVEVTPAERPAEARGAFQPLPPPGEPPARPEWQELRDWMERPRGEEGERGFRFRLFGPGRILPPGVDVRVPLPGFLSVTVERGEGDAPAKITVQKGDEKWEVTEDDLGELPEQVRGYVEGLLGRAPEAERGRMRLFEFVPEPGAPPAPEFRPRRRDRDLQEQIDETKKRFEERMQELEQRLKDLREKPAKPAEDPNRA